MYIVLKEGASKKEIEAVEKELFKGRVTKGFDAKKYNGVINLSGKLLAVQVKLRDEWER